MRRTLKLRGLVPTLALGLALSGCFARWPSWTGTSFVESLPLEGLVLEGAPELAWTFTSTSGPTWNYAGDLFTVTQAAEGEVDGTGEQLDLAAAALFATFQDEAFGAGHPLDAEGCTLEPLATTGGARVRFEVRFDLEGSRGLLTFKAEADPVGSDHWRVELFASSESP